jgi:hypothetical protein
VPAPDPWTSILNFLQTMIVPNWGELISMLPFFLLIGVIGPILSLVMFMWLWHALRADRRGRGDAGAARREREPALPAQRPVLR